MSVDMPKICVINTYLHTHTYVQVCFDRSDPDTFLEVCTRYFSIEFLKNVHFLLGIRVNAATFGCQTTSQRAFGAIIRLYTAN